MTACHLRCSFLAATLVLFAGCRGTTAATQPTEPPGHEAPPNPGVGGSSASPSVETPPPTQASSGKATSALDALAGAGRPVPLDAGAPSALPPSGPGLPETPGAVAFDASGCLADKGAAAKSAPASRALPTHPPEEVQLRPVPGGLRIRHQFSHACCLEGRVQTSLEGQQLTVTELLAGTPCRCKCDSTLESAVALKPGSYTVRLVVRQPGREREVRREQVSVPP